MELEDLRGASKAELDKLKKDKKKPKKGLKKKRAKDGR